MTNQHRITIGLSRQGERRRHRRHDAKRFPLAAHLVGGPAVAMVDISTRGVLLETDKRLVPGQSVSMRFVTVDAQLRLLGCVVRSSVASVSSSRLTFRTAVSFDVDNSLCNRLVDDDSATDLSAENDDATSQCTEPTFVLAVAQSASDLRELLA
jgi:hypothetical protein